MVTTVVNRRSDSFDIYIGRPSRWGNPFRMGKDKTDINGNAVEVGWTRDNAIAEYRQYLQERIRQEPNFLEPLRGKILGCWCKPLRCHGDVIVDLLDG